MAFSDAPTASAFFAVAGDPTVISAGPALPAATCATDRAFESGIDICICVYIYICICMFTAVMSAGPALLAVTWRPLG